MHTHTPHAHTHAHTGVVIGLERTEYEVSEGSGVTVCARLLSGVLERNAMVTLASMDGTANGRETNF